MRIVHINVTATLSTGRIAADLCRHAMAQGHETLLCYGRGSAPKDIPTLRVGEVTRELDYNKLLRKNFRNPHRRMDVQTALTRRTLWDKLRSRSIDLGVNIHAGLSRITDRSGFYSSRSTRRLIRELEKFKPDLIHLHNLHGYYLHLPTLFRYLRDSGIPVVWTLHDTWAYTGHCAYYHFPVEPFLRKDLDQQEDNYDDYEDEAAAPAPVSCQLWKSGCHHCPLKDTYPISYVMDQSARNYKEKRALFTALPLMVLTTPSQWLRNEVLQSYLGKYRIYALPNGINLNDFSPCSDPRFMQDISMFYGLDRIGQRKLVISVAAVWDDRKGLDDLIMLADELGDEYCVAVVGLDRYQVNNLPGHMLGVVRTSNVRELCVLYTAADLCISMSRGETMGMTLVESLACGTQVLCYDSTAMPEIVTPQVGETVPAGDIKAAADAVRRLCEHPKEPLHCIARAAQYGRNLRYDEYMKLYRLIEEYAITRQVQKHRPAGAAESV
ncbi:MAG: glycosyltransferase [Clostridiales bacterium]|nr:glycosyltransferase [Clostridiales bacterium]